MRSCDEAFAILMYTKKLTAQPLATATNAEAQRSENFNRPRTYHLLYTQYGISPIYDVFDCRTLVLSCCHVDVFANLSYPAHVTRSGYLVEGSPGLIQSEGT